MPDNDYFRIDDIFEQVLGNDAYKSTDKWVSRRVRSLLHDIADTGGFDSYDDDVLTVYIASFLSGYAVRMDDDYDKHDTVSDPAFAEGALATSLTEMLSDYQPYIQARTLHFVVENYPGEPDFDGDPAFSALAMFTALGFANGFVSANTGEEDDEVRQKMGAKTLGEGQCLSAANAALSQTDEPKDVAESLAARLKQLADTELFPKSGVRKGYPVVADEVGIMRMYATGYIHGAGHARDVKEGRCELATAKFRVPEYMQTAGRLWTTWCYRKQHSNLVRRASKDGWTFYLDKKTGAIAGSMPEFSKYPKDQAKSFTKLVNNVFAYNFMRGYTDGFADVYDEEKKK